jgi:hypothetical protein
VGTHLRRTLARVSVVSLGVLGVIPLSSGAAHAAPPTPRVFDASDLGLSTTATLDTICAAFNPAAGAAMAGIPTPAKQAAFNAKNHVTIQFDDDPLPPLGALSATPLGTGLIGPPLLGGIGTSLLALEIVDQVTALDVSIPNSGDDMIIAGDGDNVILGGAGNDYICGGVGGDVIDGGPGDDEIIGGSGEDILLGGSGDDTITKDGEDLLCLLGTGNNAGC